MEVSFDPDKDVRNRRLHHISLARAKDFDFVTANLIVDDRRDYGEVRWAALGFLDARLYILVFTEVEENHIRAISPRKANREERMRYVEA